MTPFLPSLRPSQKQRFREANKREERPTHHYTLEEFGRSEASIATLFAAYRERFILPSSQRPPA